jgi:hypothetical protein
VGADVEGYDVKTISRDSGQKMALFLKKNLIITIN